MCNVTCRSPFKSSCSPNVIRDSDSENVEMQSSVASDGAFMAVPLSLVVTADGRELSVVTLRSFLFLTDIQWSSCTPILSTKTSLLTCQAGFSCVLRCDLSTLFSLGWQVVLATVSPCLTPPGTLGSFGDQSRRRKCSCSLVFFSPPFPLWSSSIFFDSSFSLGLILLVTNPVPLCPLHSCHRHPYGMAEEQSKDLRSFLIFLRNITSALSTPSEELSIFSVPGVFPSQRYLHQWYLNWLFLLIGFSGLCLPARCCTCWWK